MEWKHDIQQILQTDNVVVDLKNFIVRFKEIVGDLQLISKISEYVN